MGLDGGSRRRGARLKAGEPGRAVKLSCGGQSKDCPVGRRNRDLGQLGSRRHSICDVTDSAFAVEIRIEFCLVLELVQNKHQLRRTKQQQKYKAARA
jgi:hypothetical protein